MVYSFSMRRLFGVVLVQEAAGEVASIAATMLSPFSIRRLLGIVVLVQQAAGQLNPERNPHTHTDYVRECMQPFLLKYDYFSKEACSHSDGAIRKNACKDLVRDTTGLNVRPSRKASIVEIAPEDDPNFKHVSLNDNDRMLLLYLATCTAYVGREDPRGDRSKNDDDWELELPLTDEMIQNVWDTPFAGEKAFPHAHAEERDFLGKNSFYGGNRVVYLQEFLQEIIPDLYWKLRETAAVAVQAGKDDGLFNERSDQHSISNMGIREIEYVAYMHQDGVINHLNWHRDTDSTYTMVHMLDRPGIDYEGGIFSIKTQEAEEGIRYHGENCFKQPQYRSVPFRMTRGSGVLFDAETHHKASAVTKGSRKVLVIEFWEHGEVDGWEWRPPLTKADLYPNAAAQIIPQNCELDNGVYQRNCWEEL